MECALKFKFNIIKNRVEYKVLILSLKIVKELRIEKWLLS